MALDAATPIAVYTGNGSVSAFNVQDADGNAIYFELNSHIKVARLVVATGIVTNFVEGVDYSLAGGPITGVVTLLSGNLPTGQKLAIWREQPLDQSTTFGTASSFAGATHTAVADRHRRIDQEIAEALKRAVKIDRFGVGLDRSGPLANIDALVKGAGYAATSTTSLTTAGSGSKVFTTQAGLAYSAGARIRVTSTGTGDWMEGVVSAYSGTTLTVTMDLNSGTGTNADWNINLSGQRGAQGPTGSTGATGPAGATGSTGASGSGYAATSTTSFATGLGSKAFATQTGLAYSVGARVRATSAGSGDWMEGLVTAYAGGTLTVSVDLVSGSGTRTDWNINVTGERGATGATGATGASGSGTGDMLAANNLSDLANKHVGYTNLRIRGADVASAGTINLDTATGDLVDVTGTTTITAITLADGKEATVRFAGALVLTNGASLVLPGGANITTAAGDIAIFRGYATGVVRCASYVKANGRAVLTSVTTADVSAAVLAALAFGPFTGIASAATTDLATVATVGVSISGTTTITSFGTGANLLRVGKFTGALTLTHNATSLILPGGANIATAAGDTFMALSDNSGNWTVVIYTKATGVPITATPSFAHQFFGGI
jgi:hypothetical protein